ncbi:MAG: hypothetical protein OEZ30_05840 [Candidatus Aminicenantes bacterium]|nr:hypothetical protein [Candidatus Aminicenantes bacterium]MDH5715066.1 hypothetical protein [Candidatus Aminicenantes bacterium]
MRKKSYLWERLLVPLICMTFLFSSIFMAQQLIAWGGIQEQQQKPKKEEKQAPEKTVKEMIQKEEDVLAGKPTGYRPKSMRDPFENPFQKRTQQKRLQKPGIAGMLINEVELVGILKKADEYIAFFNGTDNLGYFLRVNDELEDGRIKEITLETVVFEQRIEDPTAIRKTREVIKRLHPLSGER